jgi:glutamyl-tRNA reductase
MSKFPDETYEQMAERVRIAEYEYAKKQIAKGHDINTVMEAMSARLMQKLLHPILIEIRDSANKTQLTDLSHNDYYKKLPKN